MKKIILSLIVVMCLPFMAFAQRTLTGKVVDAENGQPLIGASLYWKNTTAGATTSVDGTFSLKRVSGFETLVVDYLGYDVQELLLEDRHENDITIELRPSAVDIDEVVIEGQQRGNYARPRVSLARSRYRLQVSARWLAARLPSRSRTLHR